MGSGGCVGSVRYWAARDETTGGAAIEVGGEPRLNPECVARSIGTEEGIVQNRLGGALERWRLLVVVLAGALPVAVAAQDGATPTAPAPMAPSAGGITLVASGLANPRGFVWDADGTLYVALAGTGETATSVGAAASVVKIVDGCPVAVAEGLPSSSDPYKDVLGPEAVALLDGQLYVLQGATGPLAAMDPNRPNGVYAVEGGGGLRVVADLTAWINANPVANVPGDKNPLGEPFRMLAGTGGLWILESNSGEVLWVTPDGAVRRVADLSAEHPVLTGFALAPDGGVYVGDLTPAPHEDGTAKIWKVTADGAVSDVWTGLTTVTGIAVAPDGTLYALEMATNNSFTTGMEPGTGKLVRQTGPATAEEVVTGLDYPIALDWGPDGALYVAFPAYGAGNLSGAIVRVDLAQSQPMAMDAAMLAGGRCAAATPAAASPVASPAATVG